jgi:hypothetical protein
MIMWVALGATLLLPAFRAHAYITSAILEYSGADRHRFYLNGVPLKNGKRWTNEHIWDYSIYDSADGSLPLGLFKNNGDNVLAAENWSQHQDLNVSCWGYYYTAILTQIFESYRLTINESNGDAITVWSEPGAAKMYHLEPGQAVPSGWYGIKFDDSPWTVAKTCSFEEEFLKGPELYDPHFTHFLVPGTVPFVGHNSNGNGGTLSKNLFRSHFQVPNQPDPLRVEANKKILNRGESAVLTLNPGKDAASMESLLVQAFVPQGLEPEVPANARWNSAQRSMTWSFPKPVTVTALYLASVADAPGWTHPDWAFGPWQAQKDSERHEPEGTEEYQHGAGFQSGSLGWFQLGKSNFEDGPGAPVITGVVFHAQLHPGNCHDNTKSTTGDNIDHIYLNYSVDGSTNPAVKDVDVARWSNSEYFMDGYYDATNDRPWTWAEVNNLRVRFHDVQSRSRKTDASLGACEVDVSYYRPSAISPSLTLYAADGVCRNVTVWGRVYDGFSNALSQKSVAFSLNPAVCIPTPTPTRTWTPTPLPTDTPVPPTHTPAPGKPTNTPYPTQPPTPTFTPTKTWTPAVPHIEVAHLQSNPEPFKRGGVFLYFEINVDANIKLMVFNSANQAVRTVNAGPFPAGKDQIFYNGLDDGGHLLQPGAYSYEIHAEGPGLMAGVKRGNFTKAEDIQEDVR